MKVCIAEKPSVAKDIATVLSGGTTPPRRDGYYDCGEYCVTWVYGHLCELKEPQDYTEAWRRWSLSALPMIPPRFGIKLIDRGNSRQQFKVIENLISRADEVINCGDAGQEGELIQRWVMQKAGTKCPVKRLWISSLTDESIREGFAQLKPESDFNNLYMAGLSRAIGDWLLGMNATRLYSLKYSEPGKVLSIGRVQTPTLALLVQRYREIAHFKPEDYWEIKTLCRGATFSCTSGKYKSEEEAQKVIDRIKPEVLEITDVNKRVGREAPPRLFDLTSLQVECNKKWGWSAEVTLKHIQSLYEKKVTTYPRVDTPYLSDDLYPKVPDIMRRMTPYAALTAPVLEARLIKPKRIFDNSKVTDHHAIIPTGESPKTLVGDERQLYHLIARRFIAAFYPDCTFNATTVEAKSAGVPFKATGKVIQNPGWRVVYAQDKPTAEEEKKDADKEDGEGILPDFVIGEKNPHEPALVKKTTQPPKQYTEGTLLRAMEGAGRTVDDEELREAMKENGIGRPSTRANIIETLIKRGFIRRERKNLVATEAGIALIDTITDPLLKSPKLTGIWENKLRRIERGLMPAPDFMAELKAMVTVLVDKVIREEFKRIEVTLPVEEPKGAKKGKSGTSADEPKKPRAPRITKLEQIACPHCGQGHLLKGRTAYGCSRYADGCRMLLPFEEYPADMTPGKLNALIKKKLKK